MADGARIERLDEGVIASIAAGEVVERPASAVKELVENSLDAGATRVEVDYEDRDATRIAVTDDGRGIAADQIDLAVERHATSKIRSLADVAAARTFGFRGEALASIASASELELETAVEGSQAGTLARVVGGRVVERAPSNLRRGTRIDVADLFAAVPARRKFLKSAATESAAVADVVKRFALARPDVRFVLRHNGRPTFTVAPVAGLRARAAQVLGPDDSAGLLDVDASFGAFSLHGLLSPPGAAYGSARRMSLFVGHRWVRDRMLFRAVLEGYDTHLLKGRFPACVLFLAVADDEVDVNVHPSKLEVRFSQAEAVRRFVVEAVRDALRRGASPLGRWGLDADESLRRTAAARPAREPGRPAGETAPAQVPIDRVAESRPGQRPVQPAAALAAGPREADAPSDLPGYTPAVSSAAGSPGAADQASMAFGPDDRLGLLGRLSVLGQVFGGYIVGEADDELVLVDQHAAHECMLFARLVAAWEKGEVPRQGVLLATPIKVGAAAVDAVERAADELLSVGWEIEPFGAEAVVVRSRPAIAAGGDLAAMTEAVLADLVELGVATSARRLAERVLATVACHSAVRVGKRLDTTAARALLRELSRVEMRSSCPHGRPVARVLPRSRIEGLFGR